MKRIIAVDIGGTKIAAVRYGSALEGRRQIKARTGRSAVISDVSGLIRTVADEGGFDQIDAIGVACPGPLSPSQGVIVRAPTLDLENFPIVKELQAVFNCPVILENDANAAALAEYEFGAGRGADSLAYVTVSTGVGCGIVLNGEIWQGAHEGAGELGHLHMADGGEKCLCGRCGCLETYASGTAIAKFAKRFSKENGVPEHICDSIDARIAAERARQGDKACLKAYRLAGEMLGKAFASLQMILDIRRVVMGGSVAKQIDLLAPAIAEYAGGLSYWGKDIDSWLYISALGGDAGLMGAGDRAMKYTTM